MLGAQIQTRACIICAVVVRCVRTAIVALIRVTDIVIAIATIVVAATAGAATSAAATVVAVCVVGIFVQIGKLSLGSAFFILELLHNLTQTSWCC